MQSKRMEKYVNYLLADIMAASRNVPVLSIEEPDDETAFISVEEEAQSARWEPLGQWLNIDKEWFPPACRLSENQLGRIVKAMTRCLFAFGFVPHFPNGLPAGKQYEVLVDYLPQKVPILVYNSYQLDFCNYEPKACPFGSRFCQCKVYEQWLSQFNDEEEDAPAGILEESDFSHLYSEDEAEDSFFIDDGIDEMNSAYDFDEWDENDIDDLFSGLTDLDFDPDDDGRLN
jgi:hypothetical protein